MKKGYGSMILLILISLFWISCASKPTKQIQDAQTSISALKDFQAEYYAKQDFDKIKIRFDSALKEIESQEKKLFKKYGPATQELIIITSNARDLLPKIDENKKEFKKTFVGTVAGVYVGSIFSAQLCNFFSELWGISVRGSTGIDEAISYGKKGLEEKGIYKNMEGLKKEIEESMKKVVNPPPDYKSAYDLLLEMYGSYVQLYSQATSPSGSYLSYNQTVNQYFSEIQKDYNKILVVMPEVKDEVEARKKNIDVLKKT